MQLFMPCVTLNIEKKGDLNSSSNFKDIIYFEKKYKLS